MDTAARSDIRLSSERKIVDGLTWYRRETEWVAQRDVWNDDNESVGYHLFARPFDHIRMIDNPPGPIATLLLMLCRHPCTRTRVGWVSGHEKRSGMPHEVCDWLTRQKRHVSSRYVYLPEGTQRVYRAAEIDPILVAAARENLSAPR